MISLYEFLESAVSLGNIFYTFLFGLIASVIIGAVFSSFTKSIGAGILGFLISEVIIITAFFVIRDDVQKYRLNEIKEVMASIELKEHYNASNQGPFISDWQEGLELISKNPTEVGVYIKTVQYLEDDKDIEAAATLLELGLDFMKYDEIPLVICDKLKQYYEHLPNRPKLDANCLKIYDL